VRGGLVTRSCYKRLRHWEETGILPTIQMPCVRMSEESGYLRIQSSLHTKRKKVIERDETDAVTAKTHERPATKTSTEDLVESCQNYDPGWNRTNCSINLTSTPQRSTVCNADGKSWTSFLEESAMKMRVTGPTIERHDYKDNFAFIQYYMVQPIRQVR